ncbi:hypothetical protein L5F43_09860 [Aliarcobacter butzleri]|uniref:hypothetical protein n=1 Tax=Aliarcobacter butzleri TaxID=28197 RepID=UPI001EDB6203|nr:hypothetical protein [Aliarcobacter butzleri]MCG3688480.1 hypothetical protein [Aliarcobacter butzleri]MCG3706782.1 hypothetical protein [Aliarcobacter butzleri]MCT7592433.1 hypothetical protein [Aliarcobacter butzleri]MCT7649194.1 hypothetical protein [Aliarcobacter butzleri]
MRELLKKRERENLKFLILMFVATFLFASSPFLFFNLYIDEREAIVLFCFILFLFIYSFLKLNYSNEISEEDLKIIIEDEEYEDFKPFLRGMQIHIKRNRITYDYFYRASDFYEEYLKEQKNEDKKIKRQFLEEINK